MESTKRIHLDEVTLMRCILALLIVFMHSFTCYNHSWRAPVGFVDVPLYKWLSRTSFAFTLEAFVFISGYLFAFQRITLRRLESGKNLIVNKLKRLILPSIIFSVIYFSLFYEYKGIGNLIYCIISGCGHMWYLPMLFWCFIGGWLLEQIKIKDLWKLLFLVVLNLTAVYILPLQLTHAASYMVYFYGGFVVYKYSDNIKKAITPKKLLLSWAVFIVVFAILRPLMDVLKYSEDAPKMVKLAVLIGKNACRLVYASVGVMVFYCTTAYYARKHQLKPFTVKLAACCFGIYLFQQFILQLLYYKTSFPVLVGPYWLPWCGFVIAAILSYILSALFMKTKVGKFLIG